MMKNAHGLNSVLSIEPEQHIIFIYSGTLIIGPLLGQAKGWSLCQGCQNECKKTEAGRQKSGLISKVVRLSGWSHSKVPLYAVVW